MPLSQMSFDDRHARIMEIAATKYEITPDGALEYIRAINGASIIDQKKLFRLVLTVHNARMKTCYKEQSENSITLEKWKRLVDDLVDTVTKWVKEVIENNASLDQTADTLWDKISRCGGTHDRVIALSMVLEQSHVVPYAQIPEGLTEIKSDSVYEVATDLVLGKIAVFRRIMNGYDRALCIKLAVALVNLLDQIEDKDRRVAFLYNFVASASEEINAARPADCPMNAPDDDPKDFADEDDDDDSDGEDEDA